MQLGPAADPSGASRAHSNLSSLHVLTRAQRTFLHICPQLGPLYKLGLYYFKSEFAQSSAQPDLFLMAHDTKTDKISIRPMRFLLLLRLFKN
jgi:hypothetical protein